MIHSCLVRVCMYRRCFSAGHVLTLEGSQQTSQRKGSNLVKTYLKNRNQILADKFRLSSFFSASFSGLLLSADSVKRFAEPWHFGAQGHEVLPVMRNRSGH